MLNHQFSVLVNHMLKNGKLSSAWKRGEITSVYEKNSKLNKANYRPMTILPTLSKVFERIIHSRISLQFEKVYHIHVFADRQNHGCETASLSLKEVVQGS